MTPWREHQPIVCQRYATNSVIIPYAILLVDSWASCRQLAIRRGVTRLPHCTKFLLEECANDSSLVRATNGETLNGRGGSRTSRSTTVERRPTNEFLCRTPAGEFTSFHLLVRTKPFMVGQCRFFVSSGGFT